MNRSQRSYGIAAMARMAGYRPGFCTSDGIYVDGHLTFEGDCTGLISTQQVLFDPTINFAVLECARGGIIRSGIGFDRCDISVVTNISEDHLGLKDINTLEDLARVKKVVPKTTRPSGYAILNADDNATFQLKDELECKVALFSIDSENERIKEHIRNHGVAAFLENGNITVVQGIKTTVAHVNDIPLTFGGTAEFMVRNVLAATLAAVASGFDISVIREGLRLFHPSPELTPGRMNLFEFDGFSVMIDYAHNPDGYKEIKKFLSVTSGKKVGIISAPGDRRDSDITGMGMLAATTFDHIIIRHESDLRGRKENEVSKLLEEGIRSVNPEIPVEVIPEDPACFAAIKSLKAYGYHYALNSAKLSSEKRE